jgi:methylthioribose-1-phosphate isomerase
MTDGSTIPIEERDAGEVSRANYGFDVTPVRFITGCITERGVAPASRAGLARLYPEHAKSGRPEW